MRKYFVAFALIGLWLLLAADGCSSNPSQQDQAAAKAANRNVYSMKNDVEFQNYNKRQMVSDDPTTILWCTASFNTPNSPMFTVPVKGKLTSGNKRPWANTQVQYQSSYNPELPGPDGMYGTSGDYRYGFTVNDVYVDFYGIPTFCTTQPTVWQRQSTTIVSKIDSNLLDAQNRASAALKAGNPAQAQQILDQAIGASK